MADIFDNAPGVTATQGTNDIFNSAPGVDTKPRGPLTSGDEERDSNSIGSLPENQPKYQEPDFSGPIRDFYKQQILPNENEEAPSLTQQYARQQIDQLTTNDVAFFKDRKVPYVEKAAKAAQMLNTLQEQKAQKIREVEAQKDVSPIDKYLSKIPGSEIFVGGLDENDQLIKTYQEQIDQSTSSINALQQALGSTGHGGSIPLLIQVEGENAKKAIENPDALSGLTDDQIKENAGIAGVRVRNIASIDSDGNPDGKYKELAYQEPMKVMANEGGDEVQYTGMSPLERKGYQRDGIFQDIGTLADDIKEKQDAFKEIRDKHNELVKDYNKAPSKEAEKAISDYDSQFYNPASEYINKQIGNVKRLEKIAKEGFTDLRQSEQEAQDRNNAYIDTIESLHNDYKDGFWKGTAKGLASGKLLDLYGPAVVDATYNELERTGWGLGKLLGTPTELLDYAIHGNTNQYKSDLYSSESRLRDELYPVPDRYLNPQVFETDAEGNNILNKINWVEAGPLALKTTLQSLEIAGATALTGGGLATAGVFGAEEGALTAAMKASIMPVTAAMTYGDFLYSNIEFGMNPNQAAGLSLFQALVEGVTERFSPLEAKVFNPEYWSTHALTYETRRGVMRSLFKSITRKELSDAAEKTLLQRSKDLFSKFSQDNLLNFAVTAAKGAAQGAYTVIQETAEEVASDILNSPINKVADQYVRGYGYQDLSKDSLLYTTISSAITMLPTGIFGAGSTMLHKQLPGFRLQVARNADMYQKMLDYDFVSNKISKQQYDNASREIQRIKGLSQTNSQVLNNLEDKIEQADYINLLVGRDQLGENIGKTSTSMPIKGAALAEFLNEVPEYIGTGKNKKLNTEKKTNAELHAIELEKFQNAINDYTTKAYKNASLSKEERLGRQETTLLKATKERFNDNFIASLWDERQVKFHQSNLLGRSYYMPTEKVQNLVKDINSKLETRLSEIKAEKEVNTTPQKVEIDLTPKTEQITVGGKDYNVTYNENFETQDFRNPDGSEVENEVERQAILDHLYDKVDKDLEARAAGTTVAKPATTVKIKTKDGVKEYQIGKPYFVGKIVSEDADGHKLIRFPELTILGTEADGSIRIQETGKEPRVISANSLADFKLGTKESVAKNKAAAFYFNNANVVFEYKFGKGVKRTGRIEYDSAKKELLFIYKDKEGKIQQRELTEKDLVPQKGFDEARLQPKEDKDGKPIDLLAKERIRREQEAAALESFTEAKKRLETRRSGILQDFLNKKQKIVDRIKTKLNNIEDRLDTNAKDMEKTQESLSFYWKKKEEGFKGISKAKLSTKIGELLEFGRNLENEKAELEEEFRDLQEKLDKSTADLIATQDIIEDLDDELDDTSKGFSGILTGRLAEYKAVLKEAKNLIKNGEAMLKAISDTIDAVKSLVFSIIDSIEKKYPNLTNLSKEAAEDYIESEVPTRFTGKDKRTKTKVEKSRIKDRLKDLDENVETLDNQEAKFVALQKRITQAKGELNEFKPKVKVLTQLLKEVSAKEAEFNSEKNQKKRESAKKTLGMESKATSDTSSNVSTKSPAEDEEVLKQSEAQKPLDILFSSTVTPDQLKDPTVLRLVNTLNKLASPLMRDGKIVATSQLKPFHKLLVITKANAAKYGLEKVIFEDDHILGVLVAEYADGIKFIGEDLEQLDSPDAETAVFASFPVAELVWSKGEYEGQKRYFEDKETSQESKDALAATYEKERQAILADLNADPEKRILLPIVGISEGFTVKTKADSNNAVQGRLISQEAFDAAIEEGKPLIVIPTVRDAKNPAVGAVSAGTRVVNMPIGRPLLKIGSAVRFLNNNPLTANRKEVIKGLLQLLVIRAAKNLEENEERKNVLDVNILDFLKRVLYWKIPAEGEEMGRNQIYLETYDGDARFVLGTNRVEIPFDVNEIESSVNLDVFLDAVFHNVDAQLLNALSPDEKTKSGQVASFFEITSVDVAKDTYNGRKWDTYQEYLLSNKNPDTTPRDVSEIPLTTNVDPISDAAPNIKGRYFIFDKPEDKPTATIAAENKNPESKKVVYQDTVYEEVSSGVKSLELIPILAKNDPSYVYVSTFASGTTLKYVLDEKGNPNVLELPANATKTLEEYNALLKDLIDSERTIIDTGTFDKTASAFSTTILKSTSEKIPAQEQVTETKSEDSAKEKARKRRQRMNEGLDSNTRLMTQKKFYETEDFQEFKKWFEANFPDSITAEQVPFVINGIAMGEFRKNAIRIYQYAERGTGYHEAFEAVWNAFISPIEREALLNEFKRRSGSFTEYNTGKKIKYSEATISQAKEEMAEEFRRFRLTGEKFTGATRQNNWFRRLINWIRNAILGKPATISEIQDRIAGAYFKARSPKWSSKLPIFKNSNNYRTFNPDDLHSIKFFSEVMDGMTAFMFTRLSKTSGSIPSILRNKGRQLNTIYHDVKFDLQQHYVGKGEFYKEFMPLYQAGDYQGILDLTDRVDTADISGVIKNLVYFYSEDILSAENPAEEAAALSEFKSGLDDYVSQWTKINNDYPAFIADHQEHLTQYNLTFEEEEVGEEEKTTNEYARDVLALSSKDNANAAIKLLIGSLIEKRIKNDGKIVDVKAEVTSLPKLVDYGQTWATLLNELAGTRNIQEQIEKLRTLVPVHPEFEKLVEKLGAFSEDMSSDHMMLRVQFESIFHKVRPNYFRLVYNVETDVRGFVTSYKLYRINSSTENEIERVKNDWVSAMRDKNFITSDKEGNKVINVEKLAAIEVGTPNFANNKKWLEKLGWTFDAPLTDEQIETFNNHVNALRNSFLKEETSVLLDRKSFSGRLRSLALLYVKAKSKFNDTQHFNIEGKPQQNTILDNFVSIHLKDFNSARTLDEFLDTVPAFRNSAFSKGSLLLKKGGPFFTKAGIRKSNPLVLGIAEGIKKEQETEGTHTSQLTLTGRLMAEFDHNLHGSFYVFAPADIKTEFPIDFGYFFTVDDLKDEAQLAAKIWDVYSEYLLDEINVIQDYNRGIGTEFVSFNEKYVSSDKLTKGQQLQLFRGILSESLVNKITTFANNSQNRQEGRVFIETNKQAILKDIQDYIQEISSETYNDFLDRALIGYNDKGYMQFYGVDTDKSLDIFGKVKTFTERDMQQAFKFRTLNYVTANIEQFKFFFSDPLFWKDMLKRTKSFVGSREHSVNGLDASSEFNLWARNNLNTMLTPDGTVSLKAATIEDGKTSLESRGFMPYDGRFKKITLADVTLVSEMYSELYNEKLDSYSQSEYKKSYEDLTPSQRETVDKLVSVDKDLQTYSPFGDINEADAQGGITLPAFRELLWRAGKWNEFQEIMYQYEMSYERQALAKTGKYEYTSDDLKAYDEAVMKAGDPSEKWDDDTLDKARFQVLKPLKAGYSLNQNVLAPSLDKYSLSPMYHRLLEKSANGLSIYNQMMDQGVNYFIFESGNKVGGLTNRPGATSYHKVYDTAGKVVEQKFVTEDNDYKYIGIQVETPAKHKTTRGTQLTKQVLSNLFDNSITNAPLDAKVSDYEWRAMNEDQRRAASDFYKLYKENKDILLAWVAIGRTNLFNKLGIKELNGSLYFSDPEIVSEFLRTNMKGNKSENIKQLLSVKDGKFYLPLDATPVSQKIQNIIFSFIDNTVIRPKLFGGSKPQIASTFFEQKDRSYVYISDKTGKYEKATNYEDLSQTEKSSAKLTSNDLKFYKEENGKISGIEVYLPWYYKGKLDIGKVDQSLLSGVGFRIPTQSLASAENLIIKGFLPKSMGDSIVVPSEITGKAGSDFDIDKLNLYLFERTYDNVKKKYVRVPFLDDSNSTAEERFREKYRKNTKKLERLDAIIKADYDRNVLFKVDETTDKMWAAIFGKLNDTTTEYTDDELDEVLQENRSSLDKYKEVEREAEQEKADHPDSELAEFRKLSMLEQNTEKALKNKYIENLQQLLSLPENKRNLLSPNSARTLQRLADEIEAAEKGVNITDLKKQKKTELTNHARLLNPNYIARIRQAFLVGKAGVGITAVNATNHILNTISGAYIAKNAAFIKFPFNQVIINKDLGGGKKVQFKLPSLAFAKDQADTWISDNLSEFLNAYVDVAKDPFIISLNAGIDNASTFLFMNKIGIPLDDIAWFMNQPVLKELTRLNDMTKSFHTEINPFYTQKKEINKDGNEYSRRTLPRYRKSDKIKEDFNFNTIVDKQAIRTKPYTLAELKKAVSDWQKKQSGKIKELPDSFYQLQWHIYQDYFQFGKGAQEMINVTSITPFDTKQFNGLGKSRVMLERYDTLQLKTRYGNLPEYMRSLHLEAIKDLYPEFLQAFSNLFFTEDPKTRLILDRALKPIIATTRGEKTFDLADYLAKEFIAYVLSTTPINYDGRERPLSDFIVPMFLGENNMVTRLANIVKRIKSGELDSSRAIEELSPRTPNNVNSPRGLKMWTSKFTSPELNQIYYEFLALEDSEDPELRKFKQNLTSFVLLQSGLNNSPMNFGRFLPVEDFGTLAQPIFAKFKNMRVEDFETFMQQVIANNPKTFGVPVKDPRTIVSSFGLVNFDSANPELAGNDFILLPYDEAKPMYDRSSVYTHNTVDKTIDKQTRQKMVEANDWSFLKQAIFMEVVDGEGNSVLYVDDHDNLYYIYREIPPLGDGIYLKEYYQADRQSVLRQNQKFRTTEEGVEEPIKFPTNQDMLKYLADRQADSAAKNKAVEDSIANIQEETTDYDDDSDLLALPVAANDFEDIEYEDITDQPVAEEGKTEETPKDDFNPEELKPCE